ncbi:uncharacterized protein LOC110435459 isoform X2 [Sorghum bicolor]|uniref:uncharacterized protein LOC110435459 isoform X2 n=1 Tax=Sorghum bicolor TaxID=4558 RepID=UPI000B42599C|nr:uncharacterized protein LOC110435459 isoform X2 [Sorghum bicolor]|eukprot:XP_021316681.1 uncharacterized protein LOC110435459 isoform X2 [Sorghum bicolor]
MRKSFPVPISRTWGGDDGFAQLAAPTVVRAQLAAPAPRAQLIASPSPPPTPPQPLTAASAVPAAALAMALRGLRRTNPVRPLPLASTASEAVSVASDASETFECSSGGGLCRWRRGSPISSIRCRRKHRSAIAAAASCRGQDVQVMGGWRAGCAGKRDFALLGVVNPLLAEGSFDTWRRQICSDFSEAAGCSRTWQQERLLFELVLALGKKRDR